MAHILDDLQRIATILDDDGRIASVDDTWTERGAARLEREARDEHQVSDDLCLACDEQIVASLDQRAVAID